MSDRAHTHDLTAKSQLLLAELLRTNSILAHENAAELLALRVVELKRMPDSYTDSYILTDAGRTLISAMIGHPAYLEFNNAIVDMAPPPAPSPRPQEPFAVGDVFTGPDKISSLHPGSVLVHTDPERNPYGNRVYERDYDGPGLYSTGTDEVRMPADLTYPVTLVHITYPESTTDKLARLEQLESNVTRIVADLQSSGNSTAVNLGKKLVTVLTGGRQ